MIINNPTVEEFDRAISTGVSLVDFWAAWCGPCRMQAPEIERASKELKGITVIKVDVDKCPELSERFDVRAIPTIAVIKDGKVTDTRLGFTPFEALKELIE